MKRDPVRAAVRLAALSLAFLAASCSERDLTIPQSPLLRYLERHSGRIAYGSTDGNIWVTDQAGQGAEPLTTDAAVEQGGSLLRYYQDPYWSPDGRSVAVVSMLASSTRVEEAGLWRVSADGRERTPLFQSATEVPQNLAWSPDGSRIAFVTVGPSGTNSVLHLVPARGGEEEVLDAASSLGWSWWPDGRSILVHGVLASSRRSADRLSLLELDGGLIEVGLPLEPGLFLVPAPVADARMLLACRLAGAANELVLADRAGAILGTLARSDGGISFSLSPDGRLAAVGTTAPAAGTNGSSAGGSGVQLAVVEVRQGDRTEAKPIASVQENQITGFFWSPDSSQLALFVPEAASQEGNGTRLSLKVLDVRRRAVRSLSDFTPTPQFQGLLDQFEQASHAARIWSPDSRNILYCAIDESGVGLWIQAAYGIIEPRRIADGFIASWSRQ